VLVKGCKISAFARCSGPLSREGTPAATPRFFRSHPKDRPIQSPLTTCKGMRRTYSYPDPHGVDLLYIQIAKPTVHCNTNSDVKDIGV
jgi:hypothetical protein